MSTDFRLDHPLQTKLMINTPGDQHEQEADRVAGQVMTMREAPPASAAATATGPAARPTVQRKCSCGGACGKCSEEQDEPVRLQCLSDSSLGRMEAPRIVYEVLRSPGHPIDTATRDFMEARFGRDFGQVAVHADAQAGQANRAISARAFTSGDHIAFGDGEYAPHTNAGRSLLAHELAHVIQQKGVPRVAVQRAGFPDDAQSDATATPDHDAKGTEPPPPATADDRVKRVVLAETGMIMIETASKSYLYELESWHIPEGTYTATISIQHGTVVFDFGGKIPGNRVFEFKYHIYAGQENPRTLLRNQQSVTVDVVPDITVDRNKKSVGCILPMDDMTLIRPVKAKPIPLFKNFSKNVEWTLGEIPLGYLGWVEASARAGVSASGMLSAGYGPGRLTDICLFQRLNADTLAGKARFQIAAALSPSIALAGELEVGAKYVSLISLASIKGRIDAKAKGTISGGVDTEIGILYNKRSRKFSFTAQAAITAAAGLQFDLTAEAAIKLLRKEVWREKWNLAHHDFKIGWQGGLRIGTDTRPHLDFGTVGALADGPQPPSVALDEASAPDPLAESQVDVENIAQTMLAEGEGEQQIPLGQRQDDPLEFVWYKPLEIYPSRIAIPRAITPSELVRDDGPTQVTFVVNRKNTTIPIGVKRSNWPYARTDASTPGKVFQYIPDDPGDENKDWLRDRFNGNLLAQGETLRGLGFDLDHVHEKQFGGKDAFENLWPADYQENQLAGGRHDTELEQYRATFAAMPQDQGGGPIEGRYFEIVDVKQASTP